MKLILIDLPETHSNLFNIYLHPFSTFLFLLGKSSQLCPQDSFVTLLSRCGTAPHEICWVHCLQIALACLVTCIRAAYLLICLFGNILCQKVLMSLKGNFNDWETFPLTGAGFFYFPPSLSNLDWGMWSNAESPIGFHHI